MLRRAWLASLPIALSAAVRGDEVMYVGGTITEVPEATEGYLDTADPNTALFMSPKGSFKIPYKSITSLEFGQKTGRRVGVAIVISVWALFSQKRKHFLTIGYKDQKNVAQGVVFEIAKGKPKTIIVTLEVRSGHKCEYESEDARKHVHG